MSTVEAAEEGDQARVVLKLNSNGRAIVSPAEAAVVIGCGLSKIYKLIDAGELPSFLIGGGT